MQGTLEKIALITGANKGIGFEVARQLGKAGCVVLLGARNPALGEDAASKLRNQDLEAQFIELDLRLREIIQEAAGFIGSKFQRLDILVNNAGIADLAADGPPSTADIEAVQRIIQTNFLGTLAVTQSMLPLLRKSESGRVVNVSSGLGSLTRNGQPDWDFASYTLLGYSASKAALNMLTVQLAFELRDTPIKVNSAEPGYTATDLNHHRGHQTVEEGAAETVRLALLPQDGPTGGFFQTDSGVPW